MVNLQYADVTCSDCGKEYVCTPSEDYFHLTGFPRSEWTADNGLCWDCFMKATNMPAQPEPPYPTEET